MATKKNTSSTKLMKKKADDAVVYQVMAALVLLCCGLLGLRSLRAYYSTVGGFSALYDVSYLIGIGGMVLALACIVAAILVKRPLVRALLPWPAAVGIVAAATGFSMRLAWTDGFPFLYFFCGALALQYIILKLYRWEFFLVSLSTVLAGGLYFCLSSGMLWMAPCPESCRRAVNPARSCRRCPDSAYSQTGAYARKKHVPET